MQEHLVGEFALVHFTFFLFTSPTDTFPFTYHAFNGLGICTVYNFQRLIFGNSRSPDKFTGKRTTQIIFTFTSTLRTIYDVNGTARYLERCSSDTDKDTIVAALLQHQEDNFSKLMDENRSKIDRNKSVPNKW